MYKKFLIIPFFYILLEFLFQRQLMNTLINLDSHHLERMEYMSRILMSFSVAILVSYATHWKIVWATVAVTVFALSANLFDVVNKSLTPEERQVITWNFLANQRDGTLKDKEKMDSIIRMALPHRQNELSQKMRDTIMSQDKAFHLFTEMEKQRSILKDGMAMALVARNKHRRQKIRDQLNVDDALFERLLNHSRMYDVYEKMNDEMARRMKVTFTYDTKPFPKNLNVATKDFDEFRLQFQQWMTKVTLAKFGEFNQRQVLQAAIMIPVGFVASSVGIMLNLVMLLVSVIRLATRYHIHDSRRETIFTGLFMITIALIVYYLFVPITVFVTSITLI